MSDKYPKTFEFVMAVLFLVAMVFACSLALGMIILLKYLVVYYDQIISTVGYAFLAIMAIFIIIGRTCENSEKYHTAYY